MRTMTVSQSLTAAHELAKHGERHLLGLTGEPGVGKSTLAALLAADLGADAVAVSMDGFHLAQKELEWLGSARHLRLVGLPVADAAAHHQ